MVVLVGVKLDVTVEELAEEDEEEVVLEDALVELDVATRVIEVDELDVAVADVVKLDEELGAAGTVEVGLVTGIEESLEDGAEELDDELLGVAVAVEATETVVVELLEEEVEVTATDAGPRSLAPLTCELL